jgi:hypothetical protein
MHVRRTLIGLAAVAGLTAAPAAQAAVLAPLAPCYRSVDEFARENVGIQASGFTPGASVDVFIDGVSVQSGVQALPDGTVAGSVDAPYQGFGERAFTLTLTEREKPDNTVSATSQVTALDMRLRPRRARPQRQVRFLGRGFIDGPEVFGHYVRGGKLRKTVSFGAPEGPCGRVDVRRRQIPIRNPRVGRWILQVDNQYEYSEQPAGVSVDVPITVRRVVRRP